MMKSFVPLQFCDHYSSNLQHFHGSDAYLQHCNLMELMHAGKSPESHQKSKLLGCMIGLLAPVHLRSQALPKLPHTRRQ